MAERRNWVIRAVVFGLAAVLALLLWLNREQFAPLESGSRAPDYTVRTMAGQPRALSEYGGQPVLLNVWATWCPPCVREMPALQRVHEQLAGEGLKIVAVSVDSPPGVINTWGRPGGDIAEFVAKYGLTFDVLWDPSGEIDAAYGLLGLPTTFLIDRKGRIRERVTGWREWDDPAAVARLRELLED
jgi:peroxiredoxin